MSIHFRRSMMHQWSERRSGARVCQQKKWEETDANWADGGDDQKGEEGRTTLHTICTESAENKLYRVEILMTLIGDIDIDQLEKEMFPFPLISCPFRTMVVFQSVPRVSVSVFSDKYDRGQTGPECKLCLYDSILHFLSSSTFSRSRCFPLSLHLLHRKASEIRT